MRVIGSEAGSTNLYASGTNPRYADAGLHAQTGSGATNAAGVSSGISSQSLLVYRALGAPETPGIRSVEIKAALAAGHYQPDSAQVASALIDSMLTGGSTRR